MKRTAVPTEQQGNIKNIQCSKCRIYIPCLSWFPWFKDGVGYLCDECEQETP